MMNVPCPKITINGVTYFYQNRTLLQVRIANIFCENVTIPHELPNGDVIDSIGNFCFKEDDIIGNLVISEGIQDISMAAFYHSTIDSVSWPSSCVIIPQSCFEGSSIQTIINIDNVAAIERSAFACSRIKKIKWPSKCSVVPEACFKNSKLEIINNTDHLTSIGKEAFSGNYFLKQLDLSKSPISEIGEHAFQNVMPSRISFPYYMNETLNNIFI